MTFDRFNNRSKVKTKKTHRGRVLPTGVKYAEPFAFRDLRLSAKLTQSDLAKKMSVTERAISQWERGEKRIHPAWYLLAQYVVTEILYHDDVATEKKETKKNGKSKKI